MILAGDIGGTKVNLALCEVGAPDSLDMGVRLHSLRRYASTRFQSLSDILDHYLADVARELSTTVGDVQHKIDAACFGIPGPVVNGQCRTVNLPWIIDAEAAADRLTAPRAPGAELRRVPVTLMNDLAAMASGLVSTQASKTGLKTLRRGSGDAGNQALIAPGTGLGEALLVEDPKWPGPGRRRLVSASEGGHCEFGPQDELQVEFLRWLWPRHRHVSWEHVAAGPGIVRIYRFLKESGHERPIDDLEAALQSPGVDVSPLITERALSPRNGEGPICQRTMDLWLFFLGAEAGNLALKSLCRGGLFIGGGAVPHIQELFERQAFFDGFHSKGRMSQVLDDMPVHLVLDQHTALYGAALTAAGLAR